MTTLTQRLAKFLRIGKARYIVGHDLAGNSYLELPSLHGSSDPRHTRRMIQWKEKQFHGDYDQRSLPVQWTMWLRHTRRDPPSLEELQRDRERIQMVQHNARVLAIRDQEERQMLQLQRERDHAEAKLSAQQQRLVASSSMQGVPTSSVYDAEAEQERQQRVASESDGSDVPGGSITTDGIDRTFQQERVPDNDVWAASRARLAEKGQVAASVDPSQDTAAPSPILDAIERRKAKRADLDLEDAEMQRARREMAKSPLEAFVPSAKPRR